MIQIIMVVEFRKKKLLKQNEFLHIKTTSINK